MAGNDGICAACKGRGRCLFSSETSVARELHARHRLGAALEMPYCSSLKVRKAQKYSACVSLPNLLWVRCVLACKLVGCKENQVHQI